MRCLAIAPIRSTAKGTYSLRRLHPRIPLRSTSHLPDRRSLRQQDVWHPWSTCKHSLRPLVVLSTHRHSMPSAMPPKRSTFSLLYSSDCQAVYPTIIRLCLVFHCTCNVVVRRFVVCFSASFINFPPTDCPLHSTHLCTDVRSELYT